MFTGKKKNGAKKLHDSYTDAGLRGKSCGKDLWGQWGMRKNCHMLHLIDIMIIFNILQINFQMIVKI